MGSENLTGKKGDTGPQGEKGDQGVQGNQGDPGPQGEKGEKGNPGKFRVWFLNKEPFITFCFFIVLAILSFSTIEIARNTQDAVQKADIIAQCTTPGTPCTKLQQEASAQRLRELKAASFCLLDAISGVPLDQWQSRRTDLQSIYNSCVANAATPPTTVTGN